MPKILRQHKLYKPYRSQKSINRQKKKETIAKLSKHIEISIHGEVRAEERSTNKNKTRQDIINSVIQGKVETSIRYKVHGDYGIYILGEDGKLITVLSKDMKTTNFINTCREQINVLRKKLGIK